MAIWRGTVLMLDIVECLTVGTCCGKANITGDPIRIEIDGTTAIASVVLAVLSGVPAVLSGVLTVVPFCAEDSILPRRMTRRNYRIIVSPRAGPTLTMESFAPASSDMYLRYFLAAEGSCENLRAVWMDVFQPGTSS